MVKIGNVCKNVINQKKNKTYTMALQICLIFKTAERPIISYN